MNDAKGSKSGFVRTLAELCMLGGLLLLGVSGALLIFDWSTSVLAVGGIVFATGFALTKLPVGEGATAWSVSDGLLVIGLVVISVGAFTNVWFLFWGGFAFLAAAATPRIDRFVRGLGSSFAKKYHQVSQGEERPPRLPS